MLDPAPAGVAPPDLVPDLTYEWRAPPRPDAHAGPKADTVPAHPLQDPPESDHAQSAPNPLVAQAVGALRSLVQGWQARRRQGAARNTAGGHRRRWMTATVTVTVAALAVVGIGRPILEQGRHAETVAAAVTTQAAADSPAPPATTAAVAAGTIAASAEAVDTPSLSRAPSTAATRDDLSPPPAQAAPPAQAPAKRPLSRNDGTAARTGAAPSRAATSPEAQQTTRRYVVQLASYSSLAQAREVRRKVESLGLQAYYQTLDTAEGRRFRVRVGPFGTRAEAERAQKRVASLRFSGRVLLL
jgi:cell division septation protein DedD